MKNMSFHRKTAGDKLKTSLFTLVVAYLTLVLASALTVPTVSADGGLILSGDTDISVYEPEQKAIVAWNGTDETLILSIDVRADGNASAVRIIPFPSNPTVREASFGSFYAIQKLIDSYVENRVKELADKYSFLYRWPYPAPRHWGGDEADGASSVTVTYHEKIGAHDITVVTAENSLILTSWIKNSLNQTVSLQSLEQVVNDYMDNGFQYFVLDLIDTTPDQNSVEPILYQFKSNFLYYPLEISSQNTGDTRIDLFLITDGYVDDQIYTPFKTATLSLHMAGFKIIEPLRFQLPNSALPNVNECVDEMFSNDVLITPITWSGPMEDLKGDLLIKDKDIMFSSIIHFGQIAFPYLYLGGAITFMVLSLHYVRKRRLIKIGSSSLLFWSTIITGFTLWIFILGFFFFS